MRDGFVIKPWLKNCFFLDFYFISSCKHRQDTKFGGEDGGVNTTAWVWWQSTVVGVDATF